MKRNVNPALIGFIAGTEGESEAEKNRKWALKMANKYGVDATTILLAGKTYGFQAVEDALKKQKMAKQHNSTMRAKKMEKTQYPNNCPKCGSFKIVSLKDSDIYSDTETKYYVCETCGFQWYEVWRFVEWREMDK